MPHPSPSAATHLVVLLLLGCARAPATPGESSPDPVGPGDDSPGSGGSGEVDASGGAQAVGGSPNENATPRLLRIENTLDRTLSQYSVEVDLEALLVSHPEFGATAAALTPILTRRVGGDELPSQLLDLDKNDAPEVLLFQMDLGPSEVAWIEFVPEAPSVTPKAVFARFVPERLDDFAWENDLTVYRTYGPALATSGQASGSGVDVWVKNTSALVIDDWYLQNDYHTDHGQGLDGYQVGTSRGAGGTALLSEGALFPAGVFSTWEILAEGPLRTVFELTYESIPESGATARETKRFTLDRGARFTQIESQFLGVDLPTPTQAAAGIVVHPGAQTKRDDSLGLVWAWEPLDGENGSVGIALVSSGEVQTSETLGHLLLSAPWEETSSFTFFLGSDWSGAGPADAVAFETEVLAFAEQRDHPPLLSWAITQENE